MKIYFTITEFLGTWEQINNPNFKWRNLTTLIPEKELVIEITKLK